MINRVVKNAEEAIKDITDNMTLLVGGFGLCGIDVTFVLSKRRRSRGSSGADPARVSARVDSHTVAMRRGG
jgi:hypothetical protein